MTDLPTGWEWTTLGEIAETSLGKMLDRGTFTGSNAVPYLRNINVQWGRFELADILTIEIPLERQSYFELRPGDLMVCEGGEIGRCAVWPGSKAYMAFQKALHRVRPYPGVDARFLRYLLEHYSHTNALVSYSTGSTIKHLPQQQLRRLPLPLPPAAEQRRIVSWLDVQLTCIEAAAASQLTAQGRILQLIKKILFDAVPIPVPSSWQMITVGEAGTVDLGRQRHPDWHTGSNMQPYLRVANVFEDRIDTDDVMRMHFPAGVFERFRLSENEILLNEGQSPEYLGRPAMYRGEPKDVAFTNSLLRFRAAPGVDHEWALLVFRRHLHAGRFRRETRITTNIAHISATRFKAVEFPAPPLEEQKRIVFQTRERLMAVARLAASLDRSAMQADALRRSVLDAAFSGRLIRQDSNDEPASMLLRRIKARTTQPITGRAQRTVKKVNPNQESMP